MKVLAGFTPIARTLIVTAAIAITVTFLQAAASILAPILIVHYPTQPVTLDNPTPAMYL